MGKRPLPGTKATHTARKICMENPASKAAHAICMKKPASKVPVPKAHAKPLLAYASDCSGLDGAAFALQRLGINYVHLWGSENNPKYRAIFKANHPDCELVEEDVCARDFKTLKDKYRPGLIDIYTSGFPCQSWSRMGDRSGINDSKGRGLVGYSVLRTIKEMEPVLFILENSGELASKTHKDFFDDFLGKLGAGQKYHVIWNRLNSLEYGGVPASRDRVYIVGLRTDKLRSDPAWPCRIPHSPLKSILSNNAPKINIDTLNFTQLRNICEGTEKVMQKKVSGTTPPGEPVFDVGMSPAFGVGVTWGHLPAITKSRAPRGFWLPDRQRFTTLDEIAKGQGFRVGEVTQPKGTPSSTIAQMYGNSFTVTMFERLFAQFLPCVGLVGKVKDPY